MFIHALISMAVWLNCLEVKAWISDYIYINYGHDYLYMPLFELICIRKRGVRKESKTSTVKTKQWKFTIMHNNVKTVNIFYRLQKCTILMNIRWCSVRITWPIIQAIFRASIFIFTACEGNWARKKMILKDFNWYNLLWSHGMRLANVKSTDHHYQIWKPICICILKRMSQMCWKLICSYSKTLVMKTIILPSKFSYPK